MCSNPGLLSKTILLSPLTPINSLYEASIADSRTSPKAFARELFSRGDKGEQLVAIASYGIAGTSYYAITSGMNPPYNAPLAGARETIFVRESVAERLHSANQLLAQSGYELYVHDGWRNPLTQRAIFIKYTEEYKRRHPGASDLEARENTLRYASDPVFAIDDPTTVPLHVSGGAVDVTLLPIGQQKPLALGTPYDDTTDRAHTAYFENNPPRNESENEYWMLRRLLNAVMLKAGFTNYPKEWWHFDFGNRMFGAYCDFLEVHAPVDVPGYAFIEPVCDDPT